MKVLIFVIVIVVCRPFGYGQQAPDSLFEKVVIFKRPAYGSLVDSALDAYYRKAGYPQATGFYVKPDSAGQLYIATAKHVVQRADSTNEITISWKSLQEKGELWSSHVFGNCRNVGLYDQDTLVDMVLVYNSLPPFAVNMFPKVHAFRPSEIVSKEEFYSTKAHQELFYIGMYPDSIASNEMVYWYPTGTLKQISSRRQVVVDTTLHFRFTYDFSMNVIGKPGISGSPILIKIGSNYKVFGLINGFLNDSTEAGPTRTFVCTAGYRILEVLREHSLF